MWENVCVADKRGWHVSVARSDWGIVIYLYNPSASFFGTSLCTREAFFAILISPINQNLKGTHAVRPYGVGVKIVRKIGIYRAV